MAGTPGAGFSTTAERNDLAVLTVIVLAGAYLRFHNLGVPSLWWDEIIVPLMARFPATTILQWSSIYEPNPPFYHLLTKFTVWLGGSNLILRFPGALMGVGTIVLLYLFCKQFFSSQAGLACAAFLAVNPLHIMMSRQVRPYTAIIFILLCSLFMLLRYVRSGRLKDLAVLATLNAFAVSLHYNAVIFMPAQAFWLWGLSLFTFSRQTLERAWWHTVSLVLSFLPVSYFFFKTAFARREMVNANIPYSVLVAKFPEFFREMVIYFDGFIPGREGMLLVLASILALAGICRAFANNSRVASLLCVNVAVPLGMVVLGRAGFLFARYVFFVYVSALVFQGVGFAWLCGGRAGLVRAFALSLVLACGYYIPQHYEKALYSADSYMVFGPGGSYDQDFRTLSQARREKRFEVFEDEGLRQALRWQETHQLAATPGDAQTITPEDRQVILAYLTTGGMAQLAVDEKDLFRRMGTPAHMNTEYRRLKEYSWLEERTPVHKITPGRKYYEYSADPVDFVSNVYLAHHLQVIPLWNNSVVPTANWQDGVMEYAFECPENMWYGQVYLELHVRNIGKNCVLKVFAFFDENENYVFGSRGPDSRSVIRIPLFHDKPYKMFRLRVQMNCSPDSPNYPGSNLDLIAFKKCVVGFLCQRNGNMQ